MTLRIHSVSCVLMALLSGCQADVETRYQGYVEGEPILVAAQQSGQLTSLTVRRGDVIASGAPLFSQDQAVEAASVSQARAQVDQTRAQLDNLATGRRPPEIAAIEAQLKDAEARQALSAGQLARQKALVAKGFVSAESLDQARTQWARDQASVLQMRAQLATARLPGRAEERAGAQAQVAASEAALEQSAIRLAQKSQRAPAAGRVQDVYYRAGEWAAAGQPVVSILPAENIKIRFFVPESVLSALRTGQTVGIHCDGCDTPVPAVIRFISASAEYTPPVLFSEKNRHRLVYMVEAWPQPEDAVRLHPGLPVDVSLNRPGQ
ncbi:MAG: HlyD family efflux transporter periplasmic adaptor subunit [Zoogloea sp.]|nr:HlyD family efflux transporter periplasmic adaptor subunit [Zoogloea sp.]